jgi:N-acetylneuraminic acid mutarotase
MRWQQLPQTGDVPVARSSHALAAVNNKLYLFGGEQQPRVPLPATTYCYDIDNGTWVALSTTGCCPGPRIAASMVAVGQQLYLYGGRTGIDMGEGAKSDLYVFDTASHEWQPVAMSGSSPQPPARSYHAMAADPGSGKLYIFGGCGSSGRLSDLWCFHIPTATWQQLPSSDAVPARGGSVLVAAADGGQLYVLGGFNGAELQDCHVFDTRSNTWACPTCCDHQPAAAAAAAAAAAGTKDDSASGSQEGGLSMLLGRSVFGAALHTSSSQAGSCCGASAGCEHAGHVVTFGGEVAPSDKGHAGEG